MTNFFRYRPVISGFIGAPGINTWHGEESVLGFDNEDPQAFATAVRAVYEAAKAMLAVGVSVNFPGEVTWHDEATGELRDVFPVSAPALVSSTGNSTGGQISRATQLVVALNTGEIRDGKRLAGRHFIGPTNTLQFGSDGQVTSATRTALQSAYGGLIDQPGPNLVVWGPPKLATPTRPASPGKKGTVESVRVLGVPGTLRSRKG